MQKSFFCLVFSVLVCSFAYSQTQYYNADKIIAIVGDKIVLKSDVENQILDMQRQGVELPPNVKCLSLEQMMNIKALVLQAEKDSLPITDEDIDIDLDNRIRDYIQRFGNKEELEKISGRTVYQLKEDMRGPIRDQKLAKAMRDKIVKNVRITPLEVQNFFNKIPKDSLPYYETEVQLGQVIIYPKPSREAEEYAIEQLKTYKQQIENGKDISVLASLYSDDPSSKENKGEFQMNRTEKMFDPTFMQKSFTLKVGQVSNPFKSQFGYHIVQLVSRSGDDAVVRHILKIPLVTSIEKDAVMKKMDSVRAQLIVGTLDFGSAVSLYNDDQSSKFSGGLIQYPPQSGNSFITIDQLDKDIIPVYKNLKVGEYSQPVEFIGEQGKKGVRILYLKSQSSPHKENIQDDYSKIANQAEQAKKDELLESWFKEKLGNYYIKLDNNYTNCDEMQKWIDASKVNGGMQ